MTAEIAESLSQEMNRRFLYVTNPDAANFNATYVAAAFLDPRFALDLSDTQKQAAQSELKRLVKSCIFILVGKHF